MQRKAVASISVLSNAANTSSDTSVTVVAVGSNAAITSSENDSNADVSIAVPIRASTSSAIKDNSSSDSCFVAHPATKAKRRQAFRQAWLKDPNFKSWLQEAEDRYKARCAVCCKNLLAGKTELKKHAESLTHKINMQCRTCTCTCHRT
ncbi:uncharacterized protein LOC143375038 [Andrena cerasifolii]|uniref:uncharacterized protein LOC143375038 n=1 Tax=Andrena cerasifolii TaxID=2819439 RepID=UPI0040383364